MASKPIVQPVQSRLVQSLTGPLYPKLTGTQYGTFPVWTPKSALGKLVVEVTFDADSLGGNSCLLGDADGTAERLVKNIAGSIVFFYIDKTATARSLVLSGFSSVAGVRYTIEVAFTGSGVTISCGGYSSSNTDPIDPADLNLVTVGVNGGATPGAQLKGTIHRCEFIDLSPLQSIRAMACASTRAPKIPAISLGIGSTIEVQIKHKLDAGAQSLFGFTGTASPVTIANGVVASSGPVTLTQDGVAVPGSLADGRHCTLKATTTSAVTLTTLGENNAAANRLLDVAAWRIWDAATGKVYTYSNANDTGNLLVNSSTVDRLGPELNANGLDGWTPVSGTTFNSSYQFTTSGSYTGPYIDLTGLVIGQTYRVELETGESTSGVGDRVYVYTNNTFGAIAAQSGPFSTNTKVSVSFAAVATSQRVYIRHKNVPGTTKIKTLSIRRIYALATAEGAELNDRKSVSAKQTVDSKSGVWEYFNINVPVVAGKAYYFGVEVVGNSTANVGLSGVAAHWGGAPFRFVGGSAQGGFVGGYFIASTSETPRLFRHEIDQGVGFKNIVVKEVTHGLWYQSGAAMTDAAANAARAYLPPINRTYDFADAIRVQNGSFVGSTDVPDNNGQNPVVWTGLTPSNIQ